MAFSFREEGSLPPVLPSKVRVAMGEGSATSPVSLAREASSSGALPTGRHKTNLELGFRQCSFHHTMQVLRNGDFCAFSSPSALPPCSVPLGLSTSSKAADLWNIPSISRPLVWRYEVSCRGARPSGPGCHTPASWPRGHRSRRSDTADGRVETRPSARQRSAGRHSSPQRVVASSGCTKLGG